RWRSKVFRETRGLGEEQHFGRTWLAEQLHEFAAISLVRGVMETEIVHIQRERPILVLVHELPDFVHIARLAIGSHAHDLVLALIYLEAEKSGERRVQ